MREILFRGKALESHIGNNKHDRRWSKGDWIYGVPSQHDDGAVWMFTTDSYTIAVDPETVGQYTGLDDKNGKKIFEGDEVIANGHQSPDIVYRVPVFHAATKDFIENYSDEFHKPNIIVEVVGNIHDAEGTE